MKLLTSHLNLSGSTIHSQRLQGYVQSLVYLPTQNIIVIHCGAHRHTYTECMAIYRMHLSLFLCAMLLSTWQKYSKLLQLLLCYSYDIWNEHKFWKAFYSSLLLKAFKIFTVSLWPCRTWLTPCEIKGSHFPCHTAEPFQVLLLSGKVKAFWYFLCNRSYMKTFVV